MTATRNFQALLILSFTSAGGLRMSCEPGEELKSHSLACNISRSKDPFTWYKGSSLISTCLSSSHECNTSRQLNGSYTASLANNITTLFLINATRQTEGDYYCRDGESKSVFCDFRVYATPDSVSCQAPELEPDRVNVKVMCTVRRTYPSPVCRFFLFRNGTANTPTTPLNITYQDLPAQGEPGYFYQTCTLTHPVQDLGLGSHEFTVKAYPNVTGSSSDAQYGVYSNPTPNLTINYPKVELESCTQGYVLEGSTVGCTCRETANTFFPATTSFRQGSAVKSSGLGVTTYNFPVYRNITGDLTCQATLLNWTSNSVTYRPPKVAWPPAAPPIIDMNQDSGSPVDMTDGYLTVKEGINTIIGCRVEGGYPSVSSLTMICGPLTITSRGDVAFLNVNVTRSMDASECSCTATNSSPFYSNNKTVIILDVLFEPTVISFTANEDTASVTVGRNSELRLTCEAEGSPSPSLDLSKDGQQLDVYNSLPQKFNLSLQLNKIITSCTDAGVYSCRAQTGQAVSNRSVDVNVRCQPQLENLDDQHKIYTGHVNSTIVITIPVFGYPRPSLYLDSDRDLNKDVYSLTYLSRRPSYGVVSLTISTVTATVFQSYRLIVTNSEGVIACHFQIEEGPASPDEGFNVVAVVGGAVAGVVVVVAVVLIGVNLKRRGSRSANIQPKTPKNNGLPQPHYEEITDVNPRYIGVSHATSQSQYAETRDGPTPPEYPAPPRDGPTPPEYPAPPRDGPTPPEYPAPPRDGLSQSEYEELRDDPSHWQYVELIDAPSRHPNAMTRIAQSNRPGNSRDPRIGSDLHKQAVEYENTVPAPNSRARIIDSDLPRQAVEYENTVSAL